MAVMSSQVADGVAFEQKKQPVPSSDKMALDSDINGFSETDDAIAASDPNELVAGGIAPDTEVEVNGSANLNAVSANESITLPDAPIDSEATEKSPSSPQLFDTNTSTSEAPLATSPEQAQNIESVGSFAAEAAIDSAVEDSAATSSVPTVVQAQDSDVRNNDSTLGDEDPVRPTSQEPDKATNKSESPPVAQVKNKIEPQSLSTATIKQSVAPANINTELPSVSPAGDLPTPKEEEKTPAGSFDLGAMEIDHEPNGSIADVPSIFGDTQMADAPSVKIAREREDDEMEGPSAKRAKTDESSNNHPAESSTNGGNAASEPRTTTITDQQAHDLAKSLRNMAVRGNGKSFKAPVAELWPDLAESYLARVPKPMDLRTMENKVTDSRYRNFDEVRADALLIYENAVAFNGPIHAVTKQADDVRKMIISKVNSLSAPPGLAVKKDKKKRPSAGAAARAPAAVSRKQSDSPSHAGSVVAEASQAYAVAPGGVPQARRGSVMNRPKRDIVPPKNKDLPYTVRPKNKKIATELRFCEEVLAELNKAKHGSFVMAFSKPVDPVALSIPNYFSVIKRPMDLSTISRKLKEGSYQNSADFDKDMRLMLSNCFKFNPPGNIVNAWGHQLETLYDEQWAKKDQYILQHAPTIASPAESPESDEEEEEEEEEAVDTEAVNTLNAARSRLVEEQSKLITLMGANPPNPSLISMQQQMVVIVQNSVTEAEKQATKKPVKKAKAPKPKKAPPPKRQSHVKKEKKSNRFMGTLEKEVISSGLNSLNDELTGQVLDWIRVDLGSLDSDNDGQFELDIDIISTDVLWKIYDLVMDHAPEVRAGLAQALQEATRNSPELARPIPKKKNKPMSKTEQDRSITQLEATLQSFKSGSQSQDPVIPTVEHQDPETSGDESDSEEE